MQIANPVFLYDDRVCQVIDRNSLFEIIKSREFGYGWISV